MVFQLESIKNTVELIFIYFIDFKFQYKLETVINFKLNENFGKIDCSSLLTRGKPNRLVCLPLPNEYNEAECGQCNRNVRTCERTQYRT